MRFPPFRRRNLGNLLAGAAFVVAPLAAARPAVAADWTPTWLASPQPAWAAQNPLAMNLPAQLSDQPLRQVARLSVGGERLRVELSNEHGTAPLVIGGARVGRTTTAGGIAAGTDRTVTFSGRPAITIPPRARVVSDPVALATAPLSQVSVSLYLPQPTTPSTFHWDGRQTGFIAAGDQTGAAELKGVPSLSRIFLSGMLVETRRPTRTVVVFGDSISDGAGSTADTNRRWPDALAARLVERDVAVLNAGISGAQVLADGMGVNALARFDRDVLAQPNIAAVIVLMGINDIAWSGSAFEPERGIRDAAEIIAGYQQLIQQARLRKVRIIGATIMPFENALSGSPIWGYHTPEKDKLRQEVNAWIRSGGAFDAIIDFDAITRDPAHPERLRADVDSGDHLHPGDAGGRVMAEAVDLKVLLGDR